MAVPSQQAAPRNTKARLQAVLRRAGALVTVEDAATALSVSAVVAAKLLARWNSQGWIRRIRRGLYVPVPLAADATDQVVEDPWTLVPEIFAPAYVSGASAAQHWDLTEQLFRSVFVMTARHVRHREVTVHGTPFVLRHVPIEKIFGTAVAWRGSAKVAVSDLHRTVIDMLDDPANGGGIRHAADCLATYLKRKDASADTLVSYAERLGNGAVFKRLGFLAERHEAGSPLVEACSKRLKKGNVKLDPALPCPRLVRRWRLWVPATWKAATRD